MGLNREIAASDGCLFNLDPGSMWECFAFLPDVFVSLPFCYIHFEYRRKNRSSHPVLKRMIQNELYDFKHLLQME
jgi:hypothetical protein